MPESRCSLAGDLVLVGVLSLLTTLGIPSPALAEPQNFQRLTLREAGLFSRDGVMDLRTYPGGPFLTSDLGATFEVDDLCTYGGFGGGLYRPGVSGGGDFLAFTPGWPFEAAPFCDPDADDTAWLAYGDSVNVLAPGQSSARFFGDITSVHGPGCQREPSPVEGLVFLGRRSADRQAEDPACRARSQEFPILVGQALVCELLTARLTPTRDLDSLVDFGFRSCTIHRMCSDRPIGQVVPRGGCGNLTGNPLPFNPSRLLGAFLQGGAAGLTVLVNDAQSGGPIPGADVTQAGGLTRVTGDDGSVAFTGVPAGGPVQFSARAPGYVSATGSVSLEAADAGQLVLSLSRPVVGARIVLNWGRDPGDLDGHLIGPAGAGTTFEVFGGHPVDGPASLDRGAESGFGPETITVAGPLLPGLYQYRVEHVAGDSTLCDRRGEISVNVTAGDRQFGPFHPPAEGCQGPGDVWRVFDFDGELEARGVVGDAAVTAVGGIDRRAPDRGRR